MSRKPASNDRLIQLLERLAGPKVGRNAADRLLQTQDHIAEIAEALAATDVFEVRYKEMHTRTVAVGRKEADALYVGLPNLPTELLFAKQFSEFFRPRLAHREEGFSIIFDHLDLPCPDTVIIETGCLRTPTNWAGDGQSSFMFDAYTREGGGRFFSIDFALESVATAQRACSSATQLILNDSVAALQALARGATRPASLLYLDSYDVDIVNPMPSAIHHMMELTAAGILVGPGTIVCVDDYAVGDGGGKGALLDRYFTAIRARVLHEGYQKIWKLL